MFELTSSNLRKKCQYFWRKYFKNHISGPCSDLILYFSFFQCQWLAAKNPELSSAIVEMLVPFSADSAVAFVRQVLKSCSTTWGRCYAHNFLRFSTIFGEKYGGFLKNLCYDQNSA
jgi:hypothetical protein